MDFLVRSALFVALIALASDHVPTAPPWQILLLVLALAVPNFLAGAYGATIDRIRVLEVFDGAGWVRRVLSSPWLRLVFWGVWAILNALVLMMQYQRLDGVAWLMLVATIPAFWLVFRMADGPAAQVKTYFRIALKLRIARFITPILLALVHATLRVTLDDVQTFGSLGEALAAHPAEPAATATVSVLGEVLAYLSGVESFALSVAASLGFWSPLASVLALSLTNWVHFYALCLALSCLLIPRAEYPRMFGRLTEAAEVPPVSKGRIAVISAVSAFFVCFLYVPAFLQLENRARVEQEGVRETFERIRGPDREWLVAEGTILQIEQLPLMLAKGTEPALAEVRRAFDAGFATMETNVDAYLDWYFSLFAEYARLAALAQGNLEEVLADRLREFLETGEPFGELERALEALNATNESFRNDFVQATAAIIRERRVETVPEAGFTLARDESLVELVRPWMDPISVRVTETDMVKLRGAASLVTAGITGTVIAKVTAKSLFKTLAKPIASKLVAGGIGTTTGAIVGGAIGSVVPVAGTAVGAGIGGALGGLATGVLMDMSLLRLDEHLTREEMRDEILDVLRQVHSDLLASLPA